MSHTKDILAGIGIFLVTIALITATLGFGLYSSLKNSQKVQHMNQLCISKGYSGWQDDRDNGAQRCVK